MKKILNICLVILLTVVVVGCSNDDTPSSELVIVKVDLTLKAAGGSGSVQYTSTVGEVSAKSSAEWCKIIDVTNNQVNISLDVNTGYEGRTALLTLTNGFSTQQLTVIQEGAVWVYDKNDTEFRVGDGIGEIPVTMSSSLPIEVNIPESVSDWLSFKLTDAGFKFIVEKNETGEVRGAQVTVKTGVRETVYSVLQYEAADLLGEWGGVAQMLGLGLNGVYQFSPNPSISEKSGGGYTLSLPMTKIAGVTISLAMTYSQGAFLITTPQVQSIKLSGYQGIMVGADDKSYYFSKSTFVVAPVILDDGEIVLTCLSDAYLMLGFFTTTIPSNTTFTKNAIEFPIIQLYR